MLNGMCHFLYNKKKPIIYLINFPLFLASFFFLQILLLISYFRGFIYFELGLWEYFITFDLSFM
jgi:hypothetical protein